MNIAITGRRGEGKTRLAQHMADKAPLRVKFDPTPNRGSFPRRPHQSYATTPATAAAAIDTLGAIDLSTELTAQDETEISEVLIAPAFDVDGTFDATCRALISWFDRERDTLDPPGVAFLVDEVWMMAGRQMPEAFDFLARCGDLHTLQLIVTAHNPQDIPTKLRPIVNFWCLFQTTDANALQVIRERCSDDVAADVQALGKHEYLLFDDARRVSDIRRDATKWAPRALEMAS